MIPVRTVSSSHNPSSPNQCSSTKMMIGSFWVVLERDLNTKHYIQASKCSLIYIISIIISIIRLFILLLTVFREKQS